MPLPTTHTDIVPSIFRFNNGSACDVILEHRRSPTSFNQHGDFARQFSATSGLHLSEDHVRVFACSMGDNPIHYSGHVRMMGAVQPFISGAISNTVNMPTDVSVEDVEQLHIDAWQLGIKGGAIYRDNCKVAQPLAMAEKDGADADDAVGVAAIATAAAEQGALVVERIVEKIVHEPIRDKLPRTRSSRTFEFRVADCKGFVTVGEYEDGRPGEIFVRVSKQGSTLAGI